MLKTMTGILAVLALLAGCASLDSSPRDTQAVNIQSTPGMAVIYVIRTNPDLSYVPAQIAIDPGQMNLEAIERSLVVKALTQARHNKTRAAKLLGLTRAQLYTRIEKYGLTDTES